MNWQAFEDNMRENAESHEIPVDTDALWENIQQKKKRRLVPFFWWITGALLLIGIGAGLKISLTSPRNAEVTGQETPAPSQKSAGTITGLPGKMDEKHTSEIPPAAVMQQSTTIENQPYTNNYPAFNAISAPLKGNNTIRNTVNIISAPDKTDGISTGAPIKNDPVIENQDAAQFVQSNTMNNEVFSEQNLPVKATEDSHEQSADARQVLNNTQQQKAIGLKTPALLSLPMPDLTTTPPTLTRLATPKKIPTKKRHAVIVGVEAGYYLWSIDRTGIPLEIPRTNESTLEAIHAGFTAKTNISRHLAVETGIQYNQFNSVFRWNQQWDTLRSRLSTFTYIDGHIDSTYNQDKVLYQYERTVKNYNRITSFSIPVDISYAFHAGRWTFSPYAGGEVRLYQRSLGMIAFYKNKLDGRPYKAIYRQPIGFSLRTGLSLELALQHDLNISIAPSAIIDLTKRTNPLYKEERFRQFGVTLGVTKKLRF